MTSILFGPADCSDLELTPAPLKLVHSLDNSPESHKQIQFLNLPGSQGLDAALCAS